MYNLLHFPAILQTRSYKDCVLFILVNGHAVTCQSSIGHVSLIQIHWSGFTKLELKHDTSLQELVFTF